MTQLLFKRKNNNLETLVRCFLTLADMIDQRYTVFFPLKTHEIPDKNFLPMVLCHRKKRGHVWQTQDGWQRYFKKGVIGVKHFKLTSKTQSNDYMGVNACHPDFGSDQSKLLSGLRER